MISPKNQGGNDALDSDLNADGSSDTVTVASGQTNNTLDGGLYQRASLGDRVWLDTNGNGRQDAGEAGVAQVTVRLLNAAGTVVATTTTDANGNYLFNNLVPGTYSVQFVAPTGYIFTTRDAAGSTDANDSDADANGRTIQTVLESGENDLSWDAGLRAIPKGCIGDRVWLDSNRNGIQDAGEGNIAGVKVELLNGHTGAVLATTTTDASGNYRFEHLDAGTYQVRVTAPDQYRFTVKDAGSNDAVDNDFAAEVNTAKNLIVNGGFEDGVNIGHAGWGFFTSLPGWTGVGSGIEVGRGGIYGVSGFGGQNVVELDAACNGRGTGLQQAVQTEAGKVYELSFDLGLRAHTAASTNTVEVFWRGSKIATLTPNSTVMANYKFTVTGSGGADVLQFLEAGSDDHVGGILDNVKLVQAVTINPQVATSAKIDLTQGECDVNWDAGLVLKAKASVGDRVWHDKNYNGVQDLTETGVSDVKVFLQNAQGVTIATTVTDANGNYGFTNLDAGTYRLAFDKSAAKWEGKNISHYRWTNKDRGNDDALDSDVAGGSQTISHTDFFHLAAGTHDSTRDAGLFTPLVIDLNGDGVRTISRGMAGGMFDLFGSGTAISSGWASAEDGLLAIDTNGNGIIDNGTELFGGFEKGAGFAKLASFDTNGDGRVDANDADFNSLRIWQDANGNHQTDVGELRSLIEAGISSLDVGYVELPFVDANGNLHLERSAATLTDGRTVDMTDVYFNVDAADARAAGVELLSFAELLGEDTSLDMLLGGMMTAQGPVPSGTASVAEADSDLDTMRMVLSQLERHEQVVMG